MEGAEKLPTQWREVASREMQLIDKQMFSAGVVRLRMKAHQTYSIYINTTSSCGVRFFNSSDGHVGEIGEEFESDGVVSVYVGRKSESSTPFAEIPMEPRAFRGKISYRTYNYSTTELVNHAMFSYMRAFIVTRMLVALISYVESYQDEHDALINNNNNNNSNSNNNSKKISKNKFSLYHYNKLLSTVAHLSTSPHRSLIDLTAAEDLITLL